MFITFRLRDAVPLLLALVLIAACFLWPAGREVETLAEPGRVLIIDAGHGGEDGGASAADGTVESGINLAIAKKLELIAGLCGVDTVMTRDSEDIDYPSDASSTTKRKTADQHARVELINSYPDAVLISIHQNSFPTSGPSGCQVLYAATDGSEEFGTLTHALLCETLCPQNRRVAAPADDAIYLMKKVKCAAILVECGFLSNPEEAASLSTDSYQIKIAAVLLTSYLQFAPQHDGMVT